MMATFRGGIYHLDLQRDEGRYGLTPESATYLVAGKPTFHGGFFLLTGVTCPSISPRSLSVRVFFFGAYAGSIAHCTVFLFAHRPLVGDGLQSCEWVDCRGLQQKAAHH